MKQQFSINRVKWEVNNTATRNFYKTAQQKIPIIINPLPLLFKTLLHGQKDCVFLAGI